MDKEKQKNNTGTLNRRDFLKALSAIGGAAVISSGGTPEPLDKLVSYAVPPDNVIPGIANYYTSVIPNSPVGTPVVVRVREGRAIKVEGNTNDPITSGSTSAEDQATLQTLYDPDRIKEPILENEICFDAEVVNFDPIVMALDPNVVIDSSSKSIDSNKFFLEEKN